MKTGESMTQQQVNYARILKKKEKDNPSPMCRASYLVSNAGDTVKCYGRALRFPQDRKLYMEEMKLALGDMIMQCRLIEEENGYEHKKIDDAKWDSLDGCITLMLYYVAHVTDHLHRGTNETICFDEGDERTGRETITKLLNVLGELCNFLDWNVEEIEHLGFLHTIERFEEFERRGWE